MHSHQENRKRLLFVAAAASLITVLSSFAVYHAVIDAQPFAQAGDRGFARLLYFSQDKANPVPAEFWMEYGHATWKPEYAGAIDAGKATRWRFGTDQWTTLDTNVELTAGKQKIAPGAYYAVIEHPSKDVFNLVLLDPAPIRKAKMDAFGADKTKGGIVIPMTHSMSEKSADKMMITMVPDPKAAMNTAIEVTFGPHKLSTTVTAAM